jgi:predicted ATPase
MSLLSAYISIDDSPASGRSSPFCVLAESAAAVKPDFVVTAENAAAVTGVVCRLAGIALAIERLVAQL